MQEESTTTAAAVDVRLAVSNTPRRATAPHVPSLGPQTLRHRDPTRGWICSLLVMLVRRHTAPVCTADQRLVRGRRWDHYRGSRVLLHVMYASHSLLELISVLLPGAPDLRCDALDLDLSASTITFEVTQRSPRRAVRSVSSRLGAP